MNPNIEIRPSELEKVPRYTKNLEEVLHRSKKIGLEEALSEWAREISKRRLSWFEQHKDALDLKGTEVRQGFQLVLFEYMHLNPAEILVVEETERKITWRSFNFCPYLEAVKKLNMDTRLVCKYATESPVQALLSAFNPRLRFSRNYDYIRPYVTYCEETIELI